MSRANILFKQEIHHIKEVMMPFHGAFLFNLWFSAALHRLDSSLFKHAHLHLTVITKVKIRMT